MPTPNFIAYIIGPYRAPTISGVRRNIEAARELAELLWRNNIPTICSHLNTALMDGIVPDQVFLDGDLVLLSRCNIAFVLPNSDLSKGSLHEILVCHETFNIPVVRVPNGFRAWSPDVANRFVVDALASAFSIRFVVDALASAFSLRDVSDSSHPSDPSNSPRKDPTP